MELRKEHYIILLIMITEVLGFSLILPFLPLFAQELGANPLVVGLIFTSFSVFQLFSAPIMGRLSDRYGRRPMLVISQFSTFVGFLVLGFANTLALIFLSRIIDGLFGSNFTIAQAYMSDISSKKDRSKIFGLTGAAFGVGFLIGPAFGGYLAQFSYSLPGFVAAAISLVTIALTIFLLPETVKKRKDAKMDFKIIDFSQFKRYLSEKKTGSRLWPYFTFVLSHMIFVSMLALFGQKQLGIGAAEIGFLLTYVGMTAIIIRGGLLPRLIDRCGEKKLQYIAMTSMIIGLVLMAFITEFWMLFVTITLFSFGAGTTRPLLTGEISRQVSEQEQGAILGVSDSLGSFAMILGPLIGGAMIMYLFPGSMALAAAAVMIIGLAIMIRDDSAD
jgi:DHA1 family tetracycline resistance protein-like MFS transporter